AAMRAGMVDDERDEGGVGRGRHVGRRLRQAAILPASDIPGPGTGPGDDATITPIPNPYENDRRHFMRGRDVFMQSLVAHGVEHIFGNPGTTESPLLDALAAWPAIDYVCHLHEGMAVGAASYYARASGRNAVVSLHVAPGLG